MIKNISKYKPAIIFLACPNNPTSNLWDKDKIIQIIESSESIVVIDEAYVDFCESSYIDLIWPTQRLNIAVNTPQNIKPNTPIALKG